MATSLSLAPEDDPELEQRHWEEVVVRDWEESDQQSRPDSALWDELGL